MSREHRWLEAHFADIRPRAMAGLCRQFRDLELAQESFAIACLRALDKWPTQGLPDNPFAWLMTVARNAGLDILRGQQRRSDGRDTAENIADLPAAPMEEYIDPQGIGDDVLRLLFICCHPELPPQDQSALALRIVVGLSVAEIADAFLVKQKAMEQRITRAKQKISRAQVPFDVPDRTERYRRLNTVMLMLYLQFNEGWSASRPGGEHIKTRLCEESIRLARLLLDLFPSSSELMGLLALFLLQHSRRNARIDSRGQLITLEQQDRSLWDRGAIAEAKVLLDKALRHRSPGSYQIQAAIAAVHATAPRAEATDWEEIERLYQALYLIEPTPVIKLNHASAVAQLRGPAAALKMLEPLAQPLADYRWFHAARGAFYLELGQKAAAKAAYQRALKLNPTREESDFIAQKLRECEKK